MPTKIISLKYTASNIAKFEIENEKNFMQVVSTMNANMSISDLKFLFNAGGASDEDFDEAFSKGFDNIIMIVMRAIDDAGFLGVKMNTAAMEQGLMAKKAEAQKTIEALANSGETTKA